MSETNNNFGLDLPNLLYFIGKTTFRIDRDNDLNLNDVISLACVKFAVLEDYMDKGLTSRLHKQSFSIEIWLLLALLLSVARNFKVSDEILKEGFNKALKILKDKGSFDLE